MLCEATFDHFSKEFPEMPMFSLEKESDNFCDVFTYSIKQAREIRKFHVVVMQRWQRKVQVAWCTCKVVVCYENILFFAVLLAFAWSFALLSSRNSATMVTWRHTSPLFSVWKLINIFVNDTITASCRTMCLPSFISNVTNYKDKLWKNC